MSINSIDNKRILITGGRAPTALDLARKLYSQRHDIYVADSIKNNLCRYSKAVKKCFVVPSPRHHEPDYIDILLRITEENRIDIIIPTCEEIFYLSKHKERFKDKAVLFTDNIKKLKQLHNKQQFNKLIVASGKIRKPKTCLVHNNEECNKVIKQFGEKPIIVKPAYSRFGGNVKLFTSKEELSTGLKISEVKPWIVQEYVPGRTLSTYAICYQGKVLNNIVYYSSFTTSAHGAGIYFRQTHNTEVDKWISEIVSELNYTGQIAFDMIEHEDGSLWPIECNPRATSGLHLLSANCLEKSIIGNTETPGYSNTISEKQLALPMMIYAFPNIKRTKAPLIWAKKFITTKSIIFSWKDPLPFFTQIAMLAELLQRKLKHKITLLETTTYDIEWNGEL